MNKVAFFYNLGYQMAKIAKKNEGYRYDYPEELKHQLPLWLGGALGLEFAQKPKTVYEIVRHYPTGRISSIYSRSIPHTPTFGGIAQAIALGGLLASMSALPVVGMTTETGVLPFIGESTRNTMGAALLDHLIRGGETTPRRLLGAAAAGTGIAAISRALRKKEKRWF